MWTEQDASNLRAFLTTTTGVNFLKELLVTRAKSKGATLESYAITSAKKEGWEEEFDKIEELSHFKESPNPSSPFIDTSKLDSK